MINIFIYKILTVKHVNCPNNSQKIECTIRRKEYPLYSMIFRLTIRINTLLNIHTTSFQNKTSKHTIHVQFA